MNKEYCFLIILFLVLINAEVYSQEEKNITVKNLAKDMKFFEAALDIHPDPFTNCAEDGFNASLEALKSTLNEPLSTLDWYRKVSRIIAQINDGHSSVRLPLNWLTSTKKDNGVFPYEVYLTNENKLHIIESYNEGQIPVGAEILSINGLSIDSFVKTVDPYISYELPQFRNTIIDGNFDQFLLLAFGKSSFINIEFFSSQKTSIKVDFLPYKESLKFLKKNREDRDIKISGGEPYAYKKLANGIGILSIYAFHAADFDFYNGFLRKTFKSIQKDSIHSLIIDIRGNFGGWPKIASKLFHYISEDYFKTLALSSTKISTTYQNYFYQKIPQLREIKNYIFERRHYLDIGGIINGKAGEFINEDIFFNEKPETMDFEFRGNVYLLTNRDSYSAASSFASTFQCYQMGVIIGEETGGTKIFRANPINITMPKSGLRISLSTSKLFTTCYNEEMEGIKPTIEYKPSILDLSSKFDTHLFYAVRLIKQIQKKEKEAKNK